MSTSSSEPGADARYLTMDALAERLGIIAGNAAAFHPHQRAAYLREAAKRLTMLPGDRVAFRDRDGKPLAEGQHVTYVGGNVLAFSGTGTVTELHPPADGPSVVIEDPEGRELLTGCSNVRITPGAMLP